MARADGTQYNFKRKAECNKSVTINNATHALKFKKSGTYAADNAFYAARACSPRRSFKFDLQLTKAYGRCYTVYTLYDIF